MDGAGRRVSWVELYLDLVFVLAVGQLAQLIVAEPETRSVWIALGLFPGVGRRPRRHDGGWAALVAAMIVAAALWWGLLRFRRRHQPQGARAVGRLADDGAGPAADLDLQLARLGPERSPHGYLWLLTAWMVMCAAVSTRAAHGDDAGDLERYLGPSRAAGSPGQPSRSHRGP
jgi:hypothetical protein